ncbi:MAG: NAD-dependent epimerase/dehydratase family protein, partial [Acidobacteria bacterium]|nr:NAD-dependent epimerase/dehydratase family protein [Acidobacteriota bacterium]
MKILVTGATGLVGTALLPVLTSAGHQVVRLVRRNPKPGDVLWDPETGKLDAAALEGIDGAVHLAGENIAGGRWTAARKAKIRDSRVKGTRLLSESLAKLNRLPQVLVSASAIGYYGDRGNEVLREDSPPGQGFLPDVCRQWEASTDAATRKGIRVVHLRTGLVLSAAGGALGKMLLPFKMG